MISFKNFSCYYKQKRTKEFKKILDNLSLDIATGEFVVVLGASGSGKTTMLKCLVGQGEFFDGDLLIDGVPIDNINVKTGNFAYVRQDIVLYPNLTVYENIAFPLRTMKTPQDEVDKRVKAVAKNLGILPFLTRKPRQLSGGQQQRVAICRAIIKNPRYLFFDEPFAAMEPALRLELGRIVRALHEELMPTMVFVTHDITEAFTLADRIIVIEGGKIVEEGTPDSLKENHTSVLLRKFFGEEVDEDEE